MKHARSDYQRIQDPTNLIPADEPVFLIRGQDALAIPTLRIYAELARAYGLSSMAERVENHARAMAHWQANKKKLPDAPDDDPVPPAAAAKAAS